MNWLTTDQIQKAAKKSRKAALECSREHWRQLSEATAKELRKASDDEDVSTTTRHCALCRKYRNAILKCGSCPLRSGLTVDCCPEWESADDRLWAWLHFRCGWFAWKRAAKAMYKKLCEVK